jgi:hypothetical protein
MNISRFLRCGLVRVGVVLVLATPANAQPTTETRRAGAEALFAEGRRLILEGKALQACPRFAESQKLDPATGTLLNLARCYAMIGRTASAWAAYTEAASSAHATADTERERFARAKAAALAAEVPRLMVSVSESSGSELEVTVDGVAWARGLWNVAAPIDPGQHTIAARKRGFVPWSRTFEARGGVESQFVVPELRALPRSSDALPPRSREQGHGWARQHSAAAVGAGVAVAAVAIGTMLALEAQSAYDRSESFCTSDERCDPRGISLRDEAFDDARLATIAFGFAGSAIVGTTLLWITAPPLGNPAREHGSRGGSDRFTPNGHGTVLGIRGRW